MGRYAVSKSKATEASPSNPMLLLFPGGNVLIKCTLIKIGCSAAPVDQIFEFGLYEHTTSGTGGTAATIKKLGPAATAESTAKIGTFSPDPTKSAAPMILLPVHHRSTTQVQVPIDQAFSPETVAADVGVGIWNDIAPDAIAFEHTLIFEE